MQTKRLVSALAALTLSGAMAISASAWTDLAPTDNVHKFDIGSEEVGGSGSEDGYAWIKVVQSSNQKLKLFEDVGPDVNVTALEVTFEISDWSGVEFPVTWGANIDFIGESSTTWCGTGEFAGISEYTVNGSGEYTFTCDLAALCQALGKEGIAHLQTCEMVLKNVEEGDPTVIEVKSARVLAADEADSSESQSESGGSQADSQPDSSAAETADSSEAETGAKGPTDDSSESKADTGSSSNSSSTNTNNTTNTNTNNSSNTTTNTNTNNAANTASSSSTAPDNTSPETGSAADLILALAAVSAAAAVTVKRR